MKPPESITLDHASRTGRVDLTYLWESNDILINGTDVRVTGFSINPTEDREEVQLSFSILNLAGAPELHPVQNFYGSRDLGQWSCYTNILIPPIPPRDLIIPGKNRILREMQSLAQNTYWLAFNNGLLFRMAAEFKPENEADEELKRVFLEFAGACAYQAHADRLRNTEFWRVINQER